MPDKPGDLISREEALIEIVNNTDFGGWRLAQALNVIERLQSVSIDLKQKDGKWIMDYRGRMKQCSECGVRFDTWSNELLYDSWCPNCGTRMKNDDITLEEEKNETNN